MSSGNGQKPPIPFPHAGPIPIVGQLFTHRSGFWTELVTCNCEAKTPMLLVGGAITECPACHRRVMTNAVTWNAQTGQLQVGLALVMTKEEAAQQGGLS